MIDGLSARPMKLLRDIHRIVERMEFICPDFNKELTLGPDPKLYAYNYVGYICTECDAPVLIRKNDMVHYDPDEMRWKDDTAIPRGVIAIRPVVPMTLTYGNESRHICYDCLKEARANTWTTKIYEPQIGLTGSYKVSPLMCKSELPDNGLESDNRRMLVCCIGAMYFEHFPFETWQQRLRKYVKAKPGDIVVPIQNNGEDHIVIRPVGIWLSSAFSKAQDPLKLMREGRHGFTAIVVSTKDPQDLSLTDCKLYVPRNEARIARHFVQEHTERNPDTGLRMPILPQ